MAIISIQMPVWTDVAFKSGAIVEYNNQLWRANQAIPALEGVPTSSAKWDALDLRDEASLANYTPRNEWLQNGFEDRDDSTISFVNSTRTFSITPTGLGYSFWVAGYKLSKTAVASVVVPNTEGMYLIHFNSSGTLSAVTASWANTVDCILNQALVGAVYWDVSAAVQIYLGDERHGYSMAPQTHLYLHATQGLRYVTGLGLNTMSVDQSGNSNSHAQFGVDAGSVMDEDIYHTIAAVASTTGLPIFYMTGAESSPTWNKATNSGFSIQTTGTGRMAYNQNNSGTWQLTEISNNQFGLCHVIATTDINSPLIAIMGQSDYSTGNSAEDGAQSEIQSLVLQGLLAPEMRALATVIFQTNSTFTNSVKSKVVSTSTGADYEDWRTNQVFSK